MLFQQRFGQQIAEINFFDVQFFRTVLNFCQLKEFIRQLFQITVFLHGNCKILYGFIRQFTAFLYHLQIA